MLTVVGAEDRWWRTAANKRRSGFNYGWGTPGPAVNRLLLMPRRLAYIRRDAIPPLDFNGFRRLLVSDAVPNPPSSAAQAALVRGLRYSMSFDSGDQGASGSRCGRDGRAGRAMKEPYATRSGLAAGWVNDDSVRRGVVYTLPENKA